MPTATARLSYDANGNMTTDDQGHTLVYDTWNRLVGVENIKGYVYDGLGRCVQELTLSGSVTLTRDLCYSGSQLLETDFEGDATEHNIYSPVYTNAILLRDKDTDANGSLDQRLYFAHDANYNV